MSANEVRAELKEALSYSFLYAPDYPNDDQTNLDLELESILTILANLRASVRSPYKIQQLDFAKQEIKEAFSLYRGGQDGSRRLWEAVHLIDRSRASGPPKPDFVVGSDGQTTPPK